MLAGFTKLTIGKLWNQLRYLSLSAIGCNMNKAMNIDCLKLIAFALEIKNDYGFWGSIDLWLD